MGVIVKCRCLQIKGLQLSFSTVEQLRACAEMLSKGPEWRCKPWITKHPTKANISLYYRDSLDCLQALVQSPLTANYIHFTPLQIFKMAAKVTHIYNEWRTGDDAWSMQVLSDCVCLSAQLTYKISLGSVTRGRDTAWSCSIIRQDKLIGNDWWAYGTSSVTQPGKS